MRFKNSIEFVKLERQDWLVMIIMVMSCLLLLASHFYAVGSLNEREASSMVVEESFMGNDVLRSLEQNVMEVENSMRSLVLFRKSEFETNIELALKKLKDDMVSVRSAFDGSGDSELLRLFERLVDEKIRFNRNLLDDFREGGAEQAILQLNGGRGVNLRDSIFAISDNLRQVHRAQMREYLGDKEINTAWLKRLSWFSILIILVLVPISLLYLIKVIRKRRTAEANRVLQQYELEQQLTFINDLYKNAPIGFHSVDKDDTILEMNETELSWLGYSKSEVIGKMKMRQIWPLNSEKIHDAIKNKLIAEGGFDGLQTSLLRKDGSVFEILVSARSVYNEEGHFMFSRAAVMDYSERKRLEDELEIARISAERSALLKEQFVANMSHEIRTPLNAILGFSNLLQRTGLKPDQLEFVRYIQDSSENLLTIINDILDFSKIEAGMFHLEKVSFSPVSLLHSLENMFQIRAKEKKLNFKVLLDDQIPEDLTGDPTRLTQILVNLLGNAFKFTEAGTVQLSIDVVKDQGESVVIQIKVADTGIGIPADKLEAIFDRFGQAMADTSRKYGGTGLGLTITKQLVELQNGTIQVSSILGQGTTFTVEIPYLVSRTASVQMDSQSSGFEALSDQDISILIVEDNPLNQRIVELLLEAQGIPYKHASNGQEALDILKMATFDLILMDIQMPILDGYMTTKAIRKDLKMGIPIIATTAHAFAGEREKCINYGMNDYISKPIDHKELIALIKKYVSSSQKRLQGSRTMEGDLDDQGFDRQYLLDVTRGKLEVIREMALLFIAQSEKEINQIESALAQKDFVALGRAAHSMKSTAAYMGFSKGLGTALRELELMANEEYVDLSKIIIRVERLKNLRNKAATYIEEYYLKNNSFKTPDSGTKQ